MASERIKGGSVPLELPIILRRPFLDEDLDFELPQNVVEILSKTSDGSEMVAAIMELSAAIKSKMSHSSLTLSTYILEGIIRIKAKKKGVWKNAFQEKTFGQLLNEKDIEKVIPAGALSKLKGLNLFRVPAAHFMGINTVIDEARIAIQLVFTMVKDSVQDLSDGGTGVAKQSNNQ